MLYARPAITPARPAHVSARPTHAPARPVHAPASYCEDGRTHFQIITALGPATQCTYTRKIFKAPPNTCAHTRRTPSMPPQHTALTTARHYAHACATWNTFKALCKPCAHTCGTLRIHPHIAPTPDQSGGNSIIKRGEVWHARTQKCWKIRVLRPVHSFRMVTAGLL